ncbi:hypothetical protein QBC42DRAFT_208667 [Cladorrhinum samala]|uniref:DUF4045 domain-containing protein n=1 Tax=Cladorrhinum samala TaxID=585594 RepID=A0AAV9HJB5_9PEZI|nr:hypothetical protein QBC42DRAFT_208667 [Cladorrhinum samala]
MSDEVSDFLRSVELLKERREEEDEARSRELEERILQEKKERQARRAERARSISPQKSSPAHTPSPSAHRIGLPQPSEDTTLASPALEHTGSPLPRGGLSSDAVEDLPDFSGSPTKENESPFDSDIKRASMTSNSSAVGVASARSPLSWQTRPRSKTSDRNRMRPLSMVAAENAARISPNPAEPTPAADDETMSRDEIAQSLAGMDPSWFRQTADPGRGSGAFRKSQVEDQDTVDVPSTGTQLPGMERPLAAESPVVDTPRPESMTLPKLGSPLPITGAHRLDPPAGDAAGDSEPSSSNRDSVLSSVGRSSTIRSTSPTKGMGGFVQSAMMKRSDSVKRWSVNSPGGLQRADSVLSPKTTGRPKSMLRDGSSTSLSRPTSSHGKEEPEEHAADENEREDEPTPAGESVSTELPPPNDSEKETLPTSPSKTMDPRRWSPSKNSSWLEAALNKPESPKPKPAPATTPNQPAWMVEINKAKAQKATGASAEPPRSASLPPKKAEVKTGGLMRSTPMGANLKPSALSSFPVVPPVSTSEKPPVGGFRNNLKKAASPTTEVFDIQPEAAASPKSSAEAPPKNDFRGNLKQRLAAFEDKKSSEPVDELKTVFGSLRRTKTQNYVAPDELKNNILRGKAGLNLTGGPQKTERKDEFKEAILKKKEDFMKAQIEGRGVRRESSSASEQAIPEGLAKKIELSRRSTISKPPLTPDSPMTTTPTFPGSNRSSFFSTNAATRDRDLPDASPQTVLKTSSDAEKVSSSESTQPGVLKQTGLPGRLGGRVAGSGLADRFNPALAGLIARGPMAGSAPSGPSGASSSGAAATGEPTEPGPQLTHMTKNRARGPKRKAPSSVAKPVDAVDNKVAEATPEPEKHDIFPKRFTSEPERATTPPKSEKPATSPKQEQVTPKAQPMGLVARRKSVIMERQNSAGDVISLVDSSKRMSRDLSRPTGQPIDIVGSPGVKTRARSQTKVQEQAAALAALNGQTSKPPAEEDRKASPPPLRNRPRSTTRVHEQVAALAAKTQQAPVAAEEDVASSPAPLKTRPRSPTKVHEQVAALAAKTQQEAAEEEAKAASSSPRKIDVKRLSAFLDQSQPVLPPQPEPVKSKPSSPAKERFSTINTTQPEPARALPPTPTKERFTGSVSPPTGKQLLDERPQLQPAPLISRSPVLLPTLSPVDVGLGLSQWESAAPKPLPKDSPEFERPPRVPPKGARPLPEPPAVSSPRVPSPLRSPSKHASDVSAMLTEFFGPERPRRKYTTDAAEILMDRPVSTATVQTQRAQLFQISAEGKRVPVPAHHERVLFEREMYLCPHTFIDNEGKKVNEVYFWAGDEVPQTVVEDAYLFAARDARSFGGKLIKLSQGKETSEFLQALGGIVIVRRGSSNKYDSLAPQMLCGRRYLGQVAFDEVDFSPLSMCSGFPYLITQQGKCYLWKGKGSDVEELGCARLVGMDLALMGELLEIEEGSEPQSFWDVFGVGADLNTRPISADHWRLKPNYDKYSGRLFVANENASASNKMQISEISPFSQIDLSPKNIYVLDAFFEMYIIVGAKSQTQYAAFHNALDFAQEYAILAAGMEDRPFVPIATVVLEGIPRDLKAVFRKWRDTATPTRTLVPTPQQIQQHKTGPAEIQRSGSSSSTTSNKGSNGGGLRRARSLRVVPLGVALRAVQE